ncbi:putative WRKY transcription factor 7 [Tasmannia lanceolata]|uniref:putative WRKY transcription factor 7 n=1 Tax=Tasmannia lanceolata TaxID=3420 RepID=UPI004064151B
MMAVDLMMGGYNCFGRAGGEKFEENGVQEAAYAGLQSMERLVKLLSQQPYKTSSSSSDAKEVMEEMEMDAVSKFKKMISLLDRKRTGHARFRRAPPPPPPPLPNKAQLPLEKDNQSCSSSSSRVYCPTPIQQRLPPPQIIHPLLSQPPKTGISPPISSLTTGDIVNLSQLGRPPLSSSSLKRKCPSKSDHLSAKCASSSSRCHCSKRRKSRVKTTVRVPAISLKMSDIPPDEFSWRKYGQKPIKGSPHPRGYYKCSSVRGCLARKHVERAQDDPTMLVVTYEGEHSHAIFIPEGEALIIASC